MRREEGLVDREREKEKDLDPLLGKPVSDSSEGSSDEIKDEEIDSSSAPCCRICLECDGEPGETL